MLIRRLRLILALMFSVVLSGALPCLGQTADQLRRVSDFYAAGDGFSGTVVVIRNGTVVGSNTYGMANVEQGVPNTRKTRFAIGSVSKQFTAAAILILQEQGLLKTSDTLASHYPDTPQAWKDVTLRQLLQHTSGIPEGLDVWGPAGKESGEPTPQQVVASVAARPLAFQPGSRMQYNNTGYILLGLVVESASRESLKDFFQKYFFLPLKMQDTGLASSHEVIPAMASGYSPEQKDLKTSIAIPFSSIFAAGAIYSTGEDMAKWLFALHAGKVLKPTSYAEMTDGGSQGYGYALVISRQDGELDFSHDGKVPGFATQTDFFPKTHTGIVVLSNAMNRKSAVPR